MDTFATRLREALLFAGKEPTPATLAKTCGISRQTAKNWLAMREPDMRGHQLMMLAKCLNVRIRYLGDGEMPMSPVPDLPRVAAILARLTPAQAQVWLTDGETVARKA